MHSNINRNQIARLFSSFEFRIHLSRNRSQQCQRWLHKRCPFFNLTDLFSPLNLLESLNITPVRKMNMLTKVSGHPTSPFSDSLQAYFYKATRIIAIHLTHKGFEQVIHVFPSFFLIWPAGNGGFRIMWLNTHLPNPLTPLPSAIRPPINRTQILYDLLFLILSMWFLQAHSGLLFPTINLNQ